VNAIVTIVKYKSHATFNSLRQARISQVSEACNVLF